MNRKDQHEGQQPLPGPSSKQMLFSRMLSTVRTAPLFDQYCQGDALAEERTVSFASHQIRETKGRAPAWRSDLCCQHFQLHFFLMEQRQRG